MPQKITKAAYIQELKRLEDVIITAEKEHKFLYNRTIKRFFTPNDLIKEIELGHWHCVDWELISPKTLGIDFRNKIEQLQAQYNEYIQMLEHWLQGKEEK